jgi:predicted DNA-binding transcriptional regulator AlpA
VTIRKNKRQLNNLAVPSLPAKVRREHRRKYLASAKAPTQHLLDRHEICGITNVSYPTVWEWMRANKFPRSRIVGGKSMWLWTEVQDWLDGLPIRRLKGDDEKAAAEAS